MLFFYQPEIDHKSFLEGEEYQHCVKVLRKKAGDKIGVFDGKGKAYQVMITEVTGRQCLFSIENEQQLPAKPFHSHILLAPTKSIDRVEWFVEKACELGVDAISFVETQNAERRKLRIDRLEKKAISALKQSKSGFLTQIHALEKFTRVLEATNPQATKCIAVVESGLPLLQETIQPGAVVEILIGPEGDFATKEIDLAIKAGFKKVSLGTSTLRTETAGLMAAHTVNMINRY